MLVLLLLGCAWLATTTPHAKQPDANNAARTPEARKQALAKLLEEIVSLRETKDPVRIGHALNQAGRLQLQLNLVKNSLTSYQEAVGILAHGPDPIAFVDSLNGLADANTRLSKCDVAKPLLERAIHLSDDSHYAPGKAEALLILSDCQNYNDHLLALSSAQESQTIWTMLGDKRGIARSYAAIGYYQLAQTDLSQATKNSEEALRLWRELQDSDQETDVLIQLGYIEYRKGAWQEVLGFLTQAQHLVDEENHPYKMGQIVSGMAEAFSESGLPEAALPKYQQALEYYRRSENPRAIAATFLGLGKTYLLTGKHREAIENLETARSQAEAIDEQVVVAFCHYYLGQTYTGTRNFSSAMTHFQEALDFFIKMNIPMEAARTRAWMGRVYEQQDNPADAKKFYQTSLTAFRELSDRVNESATLFALGNLEMKQKDLDRAEDYLKQSIEVTENLRRVSSSNDLTAAFSATVHERYESYIECLMRKRHEQSDDNLAMRAFEVSELARARSLAELLRATQTNLAPGVDPQLAEREKLLRQSLTVKENEKIALLSKEYRREELTALETKIAQLEAEYKEINDEIRARYPGFDRISRPTAWNLQQIQKEIVADDRTVLLEYSLGKEKSYVWAVTRDGMKSFELPPQAEINKAAQDVYALLAQSAEADGKSLAQATQDLSRMVVGPVADQLRSRLIVVADGALNYIPFQVLPAPLSDEPLVASHEVVNVPSASILGQLRLETERRGHPTEVLAAFGDPVFASNYAQSVGRPSNEHIAAVETSEAARWQHALRDIEPVGDKIDPSSIQPLFYSKLELAHLREIAGPKSFVATGFEASRERLEQTDLTKYAILHFATHGILDPKRPENSGLFLSMVDRNGRGQNGFIGLQDIYRLHAPVDLVVLSACRTGLGKDVRGEGLIGLTRGFMYAGASSVLASLWKVDDEATAELMKRFYANALQQRMTPAAALRAAQNSIRQEPEWRSPHFWAAFTLQGEYNKAISPPSSSWLSRNTATIVTTIFIFLFFFVAAWWYQRRAMRQFTQQ